MTAPAKFALQLLDRLIADAEAKAERQRAVRDWHEMGYYLAVAAWFRRTRARLEQLAGTGDPARILDRLLDDGGGPGEGRG